MMSVLPSNESLNLSMFGILFLLPLGSGKMPISKLYAQVTGMNSFNSQGSAKVCSSETLSSWTIMGSPALDPFEPGILVGNGTDFLKSSCF